jgi:hypothetical protein
MNYTLIILGIILILVLYILYRFIYDRQTTINEMDYLKDGISDVTFANLANPASVRYTYSIWIYANQAGDNDIFLIEDDIAGTAGVYRFKLHVTTAGELKYNIHTKPTVAAAADETHIITSNFPFQKWVCVAISVDNNIIDSYLDGKLVKSQQIKEIQGPTSKTSTIKHGTGDMYIAKFERLDTPIDPQTAWNMYMSGNGGSYISNAFASYGANLILTKDQVDAKKFILF